MSTTEPTLEDFENLDLNPIKYLLALKPQGPRWPLERVERTASDYKRFLFLNARYSSRKLVPSKDVDDFWHLHILDTEKYLSDCERLFGEYLHHFPYFGLGGDEDSRRYEQARIETNALFYSEFGRYPYDTVDGALCNGSDDIGFAPNADVLRGRGIAAHIYMTCRGSSRQQRVKDLA